MSNLMEEVLYYTAIEDDVNFNVLLDKLKSKFYNCNTSKIPELIKYIQEYDLGDYELTSIDMKIICDTLNLPVYSL